MGGPYEAFGDDRIALIVDLEPSAIHEPRPGPLDDPALREDLEPTRVDLFTTSTPTWWRAAVLDEGRLKPASHQSFAKRPERSRARSATAIPPTLSEMLAATTTTATSRPRVSTIPKVLRPLIFFPASKPFVFLLTVEAARTERASTIPADGSASRLRLRGPPPRDGGDALPGAVARPLEVIAVHGVPVRVALGQRPPLTTGRRDVEDGVDHPAPVDLHRPAHRAGRPIRSDKIGDELPLVIGHIAVGRSPCLCQCRRIGLHAQTLRD